MNHTHPSLKMALFLLFFIYILSTTTAEPRYENSTNICQRCICNKSEDAQTITMDCTNQNFSYMLANWPEHNSTLKVSFAGNNFTSLERLPQTDATLEIILTKCNIGVIYPGAFETTINVKYVDLSHNFITTEDLTPDKFRGPYVGNHAEAIGIEDLNLGYNQIHSLHKDIFEFLPNLGKLNLEGNDFVLLDIQTQVALTSVRGLVSLNLGNNELTELVPGAIEGLHLIELDLSKNDLDFVPNSLKGVGKSLEILILDDNPIIEMTSETFSDLSNLTEISANNLTKLKRIDAHTFVPTPKLTKLTICNNTFLREIDPEAFSPDSASLKEFYLSNNSLNAIPYQLLKWDQLDVFDFNNNPLDCNCDLWRISTALSGDIKRNLDGPICVDPRSDLVRQVFSLEGDICSAKVGKSKPKLRYHHMSIQLAGLLVVLMLASMVAMFLVYVRCRRFMQNRRDPFVSQVIYSPLLNPKL